jgi:hypothetical protein
MGSLRIPVLLAGTTDDPATAIRPAGRMTYDLAARTVAVHDGQTPGGVRMSPFYRAAVQGAVQRLLAARAGDGGLTSADWGLVGDGVLDETDMLEEWLAAGTNATHRILLPGLYRVTRPLALPMRLRLLMRGATLLWDGGNIAPPSHQAGLLIAPVGGDVEIHRDGPLTSGFASTTPAANINGFIGRSLTHLRLSGLDCQNVQLTRVLAVDPVSGVEVPWAGVTTVASGKPGPNTNRDVGIASCTVRFPQGYIQAAAQKGQPSIDLVYVEGGRVTDCDVADVNHGIRWWGGNSDYAADGIVTNERKCSDVVIQKCRTYRTANGGVWGSMGKGIRVSLSGAYVAGDVGFDAEGCDDVVFDGCESVDGSNGCYATFYLNRNIVFRGCTAKGSVGARIYNASLGQDNQDVTFDSCTFSPSTPGAGQYCAVDIGGGPVRSLTIVNCRLYDAYLSLAGTINVQRLHVENNKIVYRYAGTASTPSPMQIGSLASTYGQQATAIVENNKIIAEAAQPASVDAITVKLGLDFNNAVRARLDSNLTQGWSGNDLTVNHQPVNAGVPARLEVLGNSFAGGKVAITSSGIINTSRFGNRKDDGTIIDPAPASTTGSTSGTTGS